MNIVTALKGKETLLSLGAASRENIEEAESSLNVKFSADYVEYVSAYGAVSYLDHELTGVCASKMLNVVEATNHAKEIFNVPADWYVIEDTHMDGIVFWQAGNSEIYMTKPKATPVKKYASLLAYVMV